MIFSQFQTKLVDYIDINIDYVFDKININIKWSVTKDLTKLSLSYVDDECTLPLHSPLFYLCSSSLSKSNKFQKLNPSFYSYWFLLDHSLYNRLFSKIISNEDDFILLISLSDGRIVALSESSDDVEPMIWYTSTSPHPITILAYNYDLNTNLLDAVLSSTENRSFPKLIHNHLILCEYIGSLIILNSKQYRRILLDNLIKSACIYLNNFLYITKNEIRSITISNLFKQTNDDIINETKILRFGHFEKLLIDGQEIILYYENGTFERLNNLLPQDKNSSRTNTLSNQTKKLTCLTTTILNLQTQASILQRLLNKIQVFYQLNMKNCLQLVNYQWKLILNEQQLRIFQPNDFALILICYLPSNKRQIYQLLSTNDWIFKFNDLLSKSYICQPILILRYQNRIHCQLGEKRIVLSFQEAIIDDKISIENYFPNKFQSTNKLNLSLQQYNLILTIRNDAALNFKKLNLHFSRKLSIGQNDIVNIEYKQQDIKVDTDVGLVDSLTIQIILSSTCLRRLIITFSILIELIEENKTIDEKNLVKQSDMMKLIDLIQETQTKLVTNCERLTDDLLLNLLQIRTYLSMFRLGSNYTVQVY